MCPNLALALIEDVESAYYLHLDVADRPGVLADVTTLAGELGVNIYDLEIAHSAEGPRGVLVLVVDAAAAEAVVSPLRERGYRVSWTAGS